MSSSRRPAAQWTAPAAGGVRPRSIHPGGRAIRCRRCVLVLVFLATSFFARAETLPLRDLYRPFRTDQVALSPDGRHLAYTVREKDWLNLVIVEAAQPQKTNVVAIGEDELVRRWPVRIVNRARVNALRWITPELLIYIRQTSHPDNRRALLTELRAIGADGKNDRKLVDQDDVGVAIGGPATLGPGGSVGVPPPELIPRPPRFLHLSANDHETVLVECVGAFAGQKVTSVFAVNPRTGKYASLFSTDLEGRLLYDRSGRPRLEEIPRLERPRGTSPFVVPQVFHYRPSAAGANGWTDWDKFLGAAVGTIPTFTHDDKSHFGPRAVPLAFGADPDVLYAASNLGRDTYGIYAFDLGAKTRTPLAVEIPDLDLAMPEDVFSARALVFDRRNAMVGVRLNGHRSAQWVDPELGRTQKMLDEKFAGRRVEIIDWDEARTCFLVLVTGWSDPGRYYLYRPDRADGLTEFLRRAPWLPATALHRAETFSFDSPAGVQLTGHVTFPRRVRIDPPPLLVYCRDIPGGRPRTGFDRDAQAFAAMGFVVAEVNYRGASGFGARHRDAAKAAFDRVPIEDVRATIDWLAARYPINRRRVALFGEGFGGYLALRALQLHPDEFRCAISLDAPTNLASWLNESRSGLDEFIARRRAFFTGDLGAISLVREPERFSKPVFIIQNAQSPVVWAAQGKGLRDALQRHDRPVEYWEITGELRGEPEERAAIVSRIGAFLNENIYSFGVGIGEAKEVK